MAKLKRIHGHMMTPGGSFWDVGAGVGKLVIAAAMMHNFEVIHTYVVRVINTKGREETTVVAWKTLFVPLHTVRRTYSEVEGKYFKSLNGVKGAIMLECHLFQVAIRQQWAIMGRCTIYILQRASGYQVFVESLESDSFSTPSNGDCFPSPPLPPPPRENYGGSVLLRRGGAGGLAFRIKSGARPVAEGRGVDYDVAIRIIKAARGASHTVLSSIATAQATAISIAGKQL